LSPTVGVPGVRPARLTPAPATLGSLLRGSGPRFARDAGAPVIAFYIGWKLVGLGAGIAAGTLVAIASFVWERTQRRSGLGAAVGLGIAVVQAIVGLASGTAIGYLAPPVVANGLYGLAFLVSTAIGRPLAGIFAAEVYPFPPEVKASPTFRRTFSIISLAWGLTFLARCVVRLIVLSWGDVDRFIVVNLLTGFPVNVLLLVWSFRYGIRSFRRSPE
jgi:hypothetical protein